ncbi:MAG: hypothetical protein R3D84_13315 [Paracoccaceae bacterium]
MKARLLLSALALALSPAIALAQGCSHGRDVQASTTCADGQVWDAATNTCITSLSG